MGLPPSIANKRLTVWLSLLPPSLTTVNLQLSTASPPARWTSSPLQAIIPFRRHRPGWRLSLRRGNEYFSKRTEPAGIISIRILGYAAVDRRAVRRRERRAGRVGHCRLFHAVPPEPGSRQAAGSEQDSHGPARPGELAHRRFEEQDGVHHTKSRFDAVRTRAGQEPRRIHPQGAASVRPGRPQAQGRPQLLRVLSAKIQDRAARRPGADVS